MRTLAATLSAAVLLVLGLAYTTGSAFAAPPTITLQSTAPGTVLVR